MVSIYDLVVGDVVPLKIGDQVEKAIEQLASFLSHVSTCDF
jgi:flagellar motor switch protein FliM